MKQPCEKLFNRTERINWFCLPQEAPIQVAVDIFAKHGAHRIGIYNTKGQLSSVLTVSHLVRWFAKKESIERMGGLKDQEIGKLRLGQRRTVTVNAEEKTIFAFKRMQDTGASGLGVVDASGKLVGNVSSSDIKDLGSHFSLRKFFIPLKEFLMAKVTGQSVPRLLHVTPKSSLEELLTIFHKHQVHRVYLVDSHESLKPQGVITLADVLSIFAVTFPTQPVGLSA